MNNSIQSAKTRPGADCGSDGKESACSVGDLGLIPGLGRSPGEGKSYSFQYASLENSTDCIVHEGHKESDTTEQLSLAIAINGEAIVSTTMIETPAAVEQFSNVFSAIFLDIPTGCC